MKTANANAQANQGCPSDAFRLQASGDSRYNGSYVIRSEINAGFTTDLTMATRFVLDSDCHIALRNFPNVIGNDFNINMTLPGPLYFSDSTTVQAQGYDAPTCMLSGRQSPTLTCSYAFAQGDQFFSCQGALSLPGPYIGDATCGAGNGDLTLTAIDLSQA